MADIQMLTEMKDWELLWDEEGSEDAGAVLLFKRSPSCPTSFAAEDIFRDFVKKLPASKDLRVMMVDVINSRPISQRIARDTGITHESPQAMLLSRGHNIVWHASHMNITSDALADALAAAKV